MCLGVGVGVAADAAIGAVPDDAAVRTITLQLPGPIQLVPLALPAPEWHVVVTGDVRGFRTRCIWVSFSGLLVSEVVGVE